jgi:hypothetical protein
MGQPSPWLLVLVCFGRHHFHTLNIVKPPHFWQHNSAICHNSRTRKIYIWDDFHGMIPSINGITQPYVFFADWDDSLNPTDRFFFQWRHEVSPKKCRWYPTTHYIPIIHYDMSYYMIIDIMDIISTILYNYSTILCHHYTGSYYVYRSHWFLVHIHAARHWFPPSDKNPWWASRRRQIADAVPARDRVAWCEKRW